MLLSLSYLFFENTHLIEEAKNMTVCCGLFLRILINSFVPVLKLNRNLVNHVHIPSGT